MSRLRRDRPTPSLGKSSLGLDILIIGAGLGGLAAAISLAKASPLHKITILEQASALSEVGAGIQIPPNSSKILIKWGLRDALHQDSVKPKEFVLRGYKDEKVLSGYYLVAEDQEGHTGLEGEYGGPYWYVSLLFSQSVITLDCYCNHVLVQNGCR